MNGNQWSKKRFKVCMPTHIKETHWIGTLFKECTICVNKNTEVCNNCRGWNSFKREDK